MADTSCCKIRRTTASDYEGILQLMRCSFLRDEPLHVAVGLTDEDGACLEMEKFCLETLADVAPGGEVVGACLNGCHEPGHVGQMEAEAESCPNPKLKKILRFLATLERRADVFGKFPEVDKLLEIRTIAVDGAWRGRGVATALMERTRQIAPELGFALIKVDCTSEFSALAMMKLDAHCVFSMKYADYCAPNSDEPVFEPEPPHTGVKTFIQIVPQGEHSSQAQFDTDRSASWGVEEFENRTTNTF
ncbi:dopamine N-acetyltransferase-like isoform X2 [Zootermopsis nevadensis]|uniref:dopamine N-acetyltransferase-like isoform X2 n=1 Tax=Zootermopsis nevadensis TaxID=136037 RepID=UPI000B8E2103|nr:dopamine N-acetyltransferase-like isoform X2 [Zootermopsis nevadensis]